MCNIYILMLFLGLYLSTYQNYNQHMSSAFNLTKNGMGILINMHFIGSFLFPVVFGLIADKYNKKLIMNIAYLLFMLGFIIILLTKSTVALAVSILIVEGGFTVMEGIGTGILADINADKGKVINLSQAFFCIGAALGPIVSEKVFALSKDFRTIYIVFFAFVAIMLIMNKFMHYKNAAGKTDENEAEPLNKSPLKSKSLWIMLIIMFVYVGLDFWTTTFIKKQSNLPNVGYMALSLFWLTMGLGRIAASRIKRNILLFSVIGLSITIPVTILLTQIKFGTAGNLIAFSLIGLGCSAL